MIGRIFHARRESRWAVEMAAVVLLWAMTPVLVTLVSDRITPFAGLLLLWVCTGHPPALGQWAAASLIVGGVLVGHVTQRSASRPPRGES